jgi:hypothetical protein
LYRSRLSRLSAILALALSAAPAAPQSDDDLVAQSQLIFRGTIVRVGASTLPEIPTGKDMAIVRVDEIIDAVPAFGKLAGHQITVVLKDPASARAGEKRTFFAASWLFGDAIGVREVGSRSTGEMTTAVAPRLASGARQRIADSKLSARIAGAVQVVKGEVIATRPESRVNPPVSEHDPNWWLATIRVDEVIKGPSTQELIVAFPNSTDVVWAAAPKFVVGQQAVWLLRPADVPGVAAPAQLTALDPSDVQPVEGAARVRSLQR